MGQVKVVFYLPLRDNDGRELRAEIDAVELELIARFGGWTLTGVVKGMYEMADKTPVFDECNAMPSSLTIRALANSMLSFSTSSRRRLRKQSTVRCSTIHASDFSKVLSCRTEKRPNARFGGCWPRRPVRPSSATSYFNRERACFPGWRRPRPSVEKWYIRNYSARPRPESESSSIVMLPYSAKPRRSSKNARQIPSRPTLAYRPAYVDSRAATMTEHDQVQRDIRRLLASETSAIRLSNLLFTPGGLFSKLYTTETERLALVESPLFAEANRRLSELQLQESAHLKKMEKPVVGTVQVEQLVPTTSQPV